VGRYLSRGVLCNHGEFGLCWGFAFAHRRITSSSVNKHPTQFAKLSSIRPRHSSKSRPKAPGSCAMAAGVQCYFNAAARVPGGYRIRCRGPAAQVARARTPCCAMPALQNLRAARSLHGSLQVHIPYCLSAPVERSDLIRALERCLPVRRVALQAVAALVRAGDVAGRRAVLALVQLFDF